MQTMRNITSEKSHIEEELLKSIQSKNNAIIDMKKIQTQKQEHDKLSQILYEMHSLIKSGSDEILNVKVLDMGNKIAHLTTEKIKAESENESN